MLVTLLLAVDGMAVALIVLAVLAGVAIGWVVCALVTGNTLSRARRDAEQLTAAAAAEAEASRQRIELEAEKKSRERREQLDKEIADTRADLKKDQQRLAKREDTLDKKLESLTEREARIDRRDVELTRLEGELSARREETDRDAAAMKQKLQQLSGLTPEQAKQQFLAEVRRESEHEGQQLAQRIIEDSELGARQRSREITLQAIQRYAAEHVVDSTVRAVKIPSDDMKGRIIGREGRNIRALERATGVDILVDDTPGVIAVSCFDPIRRAIAGEALSKLVADGRVHPSRIEEIVESTRKDMAERIIKYGNDAIMEANVRGLHPKIVEAMGKMHFRTSFGQNVLRHSIEVAYLCQIIADQLGLRGDVARRCGFLHDIGKAMDHEMEGGHPAIGMEFSRKYGEKSEEVLNAIGGHHGDIPATTPYTAIVMAADAISGARPGARRESMEMYIKRLEQLEGIARQYPFVTEAHAIQAGREVRVIIDAKKADDAEAFALAKKVAKQVEEEMTFPGEIKVTVLREVRAEATAR
jgi:ribonucrease Y